jgi:hypothetical protein
MEQSTKDYIDGLVKKFTAMEPPDLGTRYRIMFLNNTDHSYFRHGVRKVNRRRRQLRRLGVGI